VLGLWLLIAPYALGFTEPNAFWNSLAVGAVSTLAGIVGAIRSGGTDHEASLTEPTVTAPKILIRFRIEGRRHRA
jgi:SPW repeat